MSYKFFLVESPWHVNCSYMRALGYFMALTVTQLILQKAALEGERYLPNRNPTVLSCGGMYLPRPQNALPPKIAYDVLNLANPKEPIKLYVGRRVLPNLLHQVLQKGTLN